MDLERSAFAFFLGDISAQIDVTHQTVGPGTNGVDGTQVGSRRPMADRGLLHEQGFRGGPGNCRHRGDSDQAEFGPSCSWGRAEQQPDDHGQTHNAESVTRDADFAEEASALTRARTLVRAGSSIFDTADIVSRSA
ncbi:MAG: hypothetical protein QF652_08215 [Dehalococcoidia bacterium]|jgi:hypothetical protein|nr:hypothetical protein [Dehalococcoidia bacterium]